MPDQIFNEQVIEATGTRSQPNAYTCQSTAIANAAGIDDIMGIRAKLESIGEPGDPATMGVLLESIFGDRYTFHDNASLGEIRDWLKAGDYLITHGWFTPSGHVISLNGVAIDSTRLSYKIKVQDPWSEFDFKGWKYSDPSITQYTGYYSAHGLYAAIVAGTSCYHAAGIYSRGELDSSRKGAWIHQIRPASQSAIA